MWPKPGATVLRQAAAELVARVLAATRAAPSDRLRINQKQLLALSGPVMPISIVERHVRTELRNQSITLERDLHQLLRPTRLGSTVCVPASLTELTSQLPPVPGLQSGPDGRLARHGAENLRSPSLAGQLAVSVRARLSVRGEIARP